MRLGASSTAAVGEEGEEKSASGSPTDAAPSSGAAAGQRARRSERGRVHLGAWRRRGVAADAATCGGGAMCHGGVVAQVRGAASWGKEEWGRGSPFYGGAESEARWRLGRAGLGPRRRVERG